MYKSLSDKEIKMNCESRKARTAQEKQLSKNRIDKLKKEVNTGTN